MSDIVKNLDRHEIEAQIVDKLIYAGNHTHEVLDAFFEFLSTGVALKGYAEIEGLGSFRLREIAPQEGKLPDGSQYSVGKRVTIEFNPFKEMRQAVESVTGLPCIL